MRRIFVLAAVLSIAGIAGAEEPKENVGYAFGMAIGTSIKDTKVKVDAESVIRGLKDALENKKMKLTMDEAQTMIQKAISDAQAKAGEEAMAEGKAYLTVNGKKAGVKTTNSGLQYEVLKETKGPKPLASDTVKVHYEGKLIDGTVFDSSIARNEPAVFPLAGVIPGWTEGLQLMNVGSKFRLTIPADLAYGSQGAGGKIPPGATLIFDVELISIEAPQN